MGEVGRITAIQVAEASPKAGFAAHMFEPLPSAIPSNPRLGAPLKFASDAFQATLVALKLLADAL